MSLTLSEYCTLIGTDEARVLQMELLRLKGATLSNCSNKSDLQLQQGIEQEVVKIAARLNTLKVQHTATRCCMGVCRSHDVGAI